MLAGGAGSDAYSSIGAKLSYESAERKSNLAADTPFPSPDEHPDRHPALADVARPLRKSDVPAAQ